MGTIHPENNKYQEKKNKREKRKTPTRRRNAQARTTQPNKDKTPIPPAHIAPRMIENRDGKKNTKYSEG